ncbi:hypothetical protein MKX03_025537, partial [Papaver bracteatum]
RMATEVTDIVNASFGEVNPPQNGPEPEPSAPAVESAGVPADHVHIRDRMGRDHSSMSP